MPFLEVVYMLVFFTMGRKSEMIAKRWFRLGLVMMTCWITLAFHLNPAAHKILLKSQLMKILILLNP
jgi:hypothetical protein